MTYIYHIYYIILYTPNTKLARILFNRSKCLNRLKKKLTTTRQTAITVYRFHKVDRAITSIIYSWTMVKLALTFDIFYCIFDWLIETIINLFLKNNSH